MTDDERGAIENHERMARVLHPRLASAPSWRQRLRADRGPGRRPDQWCTPTRLPNTCTSAASTTDGRSPSCCGEPHGLTVESEAERVDDGRQ